MRYVLKSELGFRFMPIADKPPEELSGGAIITEEQYADFFDKQSEGKQSGFDIINGEFVYTEPAPQVPEVVTPPVDQSMADMWEALLAMSAEIEALKGGQ